LVASGVITEEEYNKILQSLNTLAQLVASGKLDLAYFDKIYNSIDNLTKLLEESIISVEQFTTETDTLYVLTDMISKDEIEKEQVEKVVDILNDSNEMCVEGKMDVEDRNLTSKIMNTLIIGNKSGSITGNIVKQVSDEVFGYVGGIKDGSKTTQEYKSYLSSLTNTDN
jgi:hypothetical protein